VKLFGSRAGRHVRPAVLLGCFLLLGGEIGERGAVASLETDGSLSGVLGSLSQPRFTQQGPKLTGGEEAAISEFGSSIALSADGNTAVVGSPNDRGLGAVWVFTRKGATWTQQGQKLTGRGENGQGDFGISVARSADGNTALVGGAFDNRSRGAVWVFTRSGTTWTQQGKKLTGSGAESGFDSVWGGFGRGVALSADGNTALISSPGDDNFVGAVGVFTRKGSTWTQQGKKLIGRGETGNGLPPATGNGSSGLSGGDAFGEDVALSADGNTALIGADQDNGGRGAAYVFTRRGSTWTQQGNRLTVNNNSNGEQGSFGTGVALSADGNTA
jgi:hypothetical protein